MAFSWMGVGSAMSMRAMAALVTSFRGISANAEAGEGALSTGASMAAGGTLGGVSRLGEGPLRCVLRHDRQ